MPNQPNLQHTSPKGLVTLRIPHLIVSGDFDPAYGEVHVNMNVLVRYAPGNPSNIAAIGAQDQGGACYSYASLHRYADDKGKAAIEQAIADACERFEATGETGVGR